MIIDDSGPLIPPGTTLAKAMATRDISRTCLADRIGVAVESIDRILDAKGSISSELAFRVVNDLGLQPEFLWFAEATYQAVFERLNDEGLFDSDLDSQPLSRSH